MRPPDARSRLVGRLLCRGHRIPESYDRKEQARSSFALSWLRSRRSIRSVLPLHLHDASGNGSSQSRMVPLGVGESEFAHRPNAGVAVRRRLGALLGVKTWPGGANGQVKPGLTPAAAWA